MKCEARTIVPFFDGFYNSLFEDYWEYKDEVGDAFTTNINEKIKEVLPSFSYVYETIHSPKYYNYETDEIYATASFESKELFMYLIENEEKFEEYCKNNFSSYDGFISFLPNNSNEFVEKFKMASDEEASSFVLGAIGFALENTFGENISNDLNEATYYDIAENYPVDDDFNDDEEDEDHYDADHAAEWMERNPHGYYNSEKDYGVDASDEKIDEAKDDTGDFTVVIYGQNMDTMVLTSLDKNEPVWDNADDKNVEPLYLTVDEAERIADEEQKTADKGIANKYYGKSFGSQTMSRAEFNLNFRNEQIEESFDYMATDKKMQFQLLDRMKQDCEYYINGHRNTNHLWAGSVDEQIKAMRELQKMLKPEWLSSEDIDRYEEQMKDSTLTEDLDDKFDRLSELNKKPTYYVADVDDEFVQGGFESEEEAQNWIYDYCNRNAITPEDFVVYPEEEAEDGSKLYSDDKFQRLSDMNESTKEGFKGEYADTDKEVEADAENKPSEEFKAKLEKNGKLKGDGTDKLDEADEKLHYVLDIRIYYYRTGAYGTPASAELYSEEEGPWEICKDIIFNSDEDLEEYIISQCIKKAREYANDVPLTVNVKKFFKGGKTEEETLEDTSLYEASNGQPSSYGLVRQGDGCWAIQRTLPDGSVERQGLYDPDEKEEALARVAELNGGKLNEDRYSKPSEDEVDPELKDDPSVQEMVKAILDNWDNYNDGEKATLKQAIFNASHGEPDMLKELYRK